MLLLDVVGKEKLPPEQIAPTWVNDGVTGALTVTIIGDEVAVQDPFETVTEYEPLWITLIDWEVELFDQVLPAPLDDVNVTEPPVQKVVGPLVEIVGVGGFGFTVTDMVVLVAHWPEFGVKV
jgi:hypothetical protein